MPTPQRGDIYPIDVSPGVGRELHDAPDGPHWYVVVSPAEANKASSTFFAVPLTSVNSKETGKPKDSGFCQHFRPRLNQEWKLPDAGHSADSVFSGQSIVLADQSRCFSVERLTSSRAGTVCVMGLGKIDSGLQFIIGSPIGRRAIQDSQTTIAAKIAKSIPREPERPGPGKPR